MITTSPSRPKQKRQRSALENLFEGMLRGMGVHFVTEYRFHDTRKWRFDFVLTAPVGKRKVAVEIEGGAFSGGAHVRGKHFVGDCEKYNEAAVLGWTVLRYATPEQMACFPDHLKKLRAL